MNRQLVRSGIWKYDGSVDMPVDIVQLDFDFWHEISKWDGLLKPGESPELNSEGFLYYVCFRSDPLKTPGWVDSPGLKSLDEACRWAESKVTGGISWR